MPNAIKTQPNVPCLGKFAIPRIVSAHLGCLVVQLVVRRLDDDFLPSIFQMIFSSLENHLGINSHPHQPQAISKQNKMLRLLAYMALPKPSDSMGHIELLLIEFFA